MYENECVVANAQNKKSFKPPIAHFDPRFKQEVSHMSQQQIVTGISFTPESGILKIKQISPKYCFVPKDQQEREAEDLVPQLRFIFDQKPIIEAYKKNLFLKMQTSEKRPVVPSE